MLFYFIVAKSGHGCDQSPDEQHAGFILSRGNMPQTAKVSVKKSSTALESLEK
jgi:hypothetical protein